METFQKICLVLTVLGALNWGMIGIFDFDLVAALFGAKELMTRLIYSLIGLAGIINIGLIIMPMEEIKK